MVKGYRLSYRQVPKNFVWNSPYRVQDISPLDILPGRILSEQFPNNFPPHPAVKLKI